MNMDIGMYRAEVLALAPGQVDGNPALVMTMRPESRSFRSYNFALSHAQAVRIQRELTELLFSDPESWIYIPEERRQQVEEL
jgi:hypothetical protein